MRWKRMEFFCWVLWSSHVGAWVRGIVTRGRAYPLKAEFLAAAHCLFGSGFLLVAWGRALASVAHVICILAEAMGPTIKHVGGLQDNVWGRSTGVAVVGGGMTHAATAIAETVVALAV